MAENIEKTKNEEMIGPPEESGLTWLLKILGGLGGGIFGTLLMLVIFMMSSEILKPVLKIEDSSSFSPMFIFMFLAMLFLGITSANVLSSLFICLSSRSQYKKISSTLVQIFSLNLIIFIILTPIYLIISKVNLEGLIYISGLHILLSSFGSFLILNIIANHKYALIGVYSAIFSILVSLGLNLLVYQLFRKDLTVIIFGVLPIVWFVFAFFEGVFNMVYRGLYNMYGMDFLRSDMSYGRDYDSEEDEIAEMSEDEKEDLIIESKEDLKGSDFLKKRTK